MQTCEELSPGSYRKLGTSLHISGLRVNQALGSTIASKVAPMRLILLLPLLLTCQAEVRVEVRNSEVWVVRDGREYQLTDDRKTKLQAELSPAQNRIAYYEQCVEGEHCTPTVVILDLEGHRITSFQPRHQDSVPAEPCSSILSIAWVGDNAVSAVCHINPSLSEYLERDLSTGQTTRDLGGYNFTVSPDLKLVAHVGWVPHFAPPYAKSEYLQIDHTTIYPLPQGMRPVEQKGLAEPPQVVHQNGLLFQGIHEFMPEMFWSPDSQRIALVDCVYDWKANSAESQSEEDGQESGRRCSLAVVSRSGEAALFDLSGLSEGDLRKFSVSWVNPHELSLEAGNRGKSFTVP